MKINHIQNRLGALVLLAVTAGLLAGCDEPSVLMSDERARVAIPASTLALMETKGTSKNAPVLIRTYKKEAEFEVWKMKPDGRYAYLKTFPMCRWSGQLGPKAREGDRQVPEGFYSISPSQMNPKSAYYLSFNVGYPNSYDRAMGRGGGAIMVHGACSSAGCFSMTDKQIAEIYAIAREGFAGGQRAIQMQSYPFRMTAENLVKYRLDPNIGFWKQLKEGSDNFEVTKQEVAVGVCEKHYVFNASPGDGSHFDPNGACPVLKYNVAARADVVAKQKRDEAKMAELAAQGAKPVRTVYADGGQHPEFASRFNNVSRPDALAQGPIDIALDDSKADKRQSSALIQLASLKTPGAPVTVSDAKNGGAAEVKVASAEPSKVQESWFGLGRWFGAKPAEPQPESSRIAAVSPAAPAPVDIPMPPRRSEVSASAKPQASSSDLTPGRSQIQAPPAKPISGAAKALPAGGFSTVAQVAH